MSPFDLLALACVAGFGFRIGWVAHDALMKVLDEVIRVLVERWIVTKAEEPRPMRARTREKVVLR